MHAYTTLFWLQTCCQLLFEALATVSSLPWLTVTWTVTQLNKTFLSEVTFVKVFYHRNRISKAMTFWCLYTMQANDVKWKQVIHGSAYEVLYPYKKHANCTTLHVTRGKMSFPYKKRSPTWYLMSRIMRLFLQLETLSSKVSANHTLIRDSRNRQCVLYNLFLNYDFSTGMWVWHIWER